MAPAAAAARPRSVCRRGAAASIVLVLGPPPCPPPNPFRSLCLLFTTSYPLSLRRHRAHRPPPPHQAIRQAAQARGAPDQDGTRHGYPAGRRRAGAALGPARVSVRGRWRAHGARPLAPLMPFPCPPFLCQWQGTLSQCQRGAEGHGKEAHQALGRGSQRHAQGDPPPPPPGLGPAAQAPCCRGAKRFRSCLTPPHLP